MRQRPSDPGEDVGLQDNARRSPRLEPEQVTCNLGEVLDLSITGARLRAGYLKPQSTHPMVLGCCNLKAGPVNARVVWSRKIKMFTYESGLEFVAVDEPTSRALARLVGVSRNQRTM